jgi:hypothetical protein
VGLRQTDKDEVELMRQAEFAGRLFGMEIIRQQGHLLAGKLGTYQEFCV